MGDDAGMIESEPKFSPLFKKVGNIFIVIMPILSVGYYLWVRFSIPLVFYVNNYRGISSIGAFTLSVGYVSTICLLIYNKNLSKSGFAKIGVIVFAMTVPLCCLSNAIFLSLPTVLDKAEISHTTYYLTGEPELLDVHVFHHLYKCSNSEFLCELTPFEAGGGASFLPLSLMVDMSTAPNEINIVRTRFGDGFTFLEYTYGKESRYYDYPAQLNDHLYYLAYYRNPEPKSTTFLLYECNLDNTSCLQLPIMYEGSGYLRYTNMNIDEETSEISVYIDDEIGQDTLIFTWGENPQCYVQGCETLEGPNR